ncbi:MAG: hypothetical protein ABIO39_14245 [Caulobacteraceae bacterium]
MKAVKIAVCAALFLGVSDVAYASQKGTLGGAAGGAVAGAMVAGPVGAVVGGVGGAVAGHKLSSKSHAHHRAVKHKAKAKHR